ncbi:phage late control D family protein [Mameliella sp.]|uniref:phage late control D family protein n=1 Tax=Mameliella sp. TaxID=1924940 RepID=UPI003B5046F3
MPDLGTVPLLYNARPRLTVDGTAQPDLDAGLMALTIEEDFDGMARCEATFGNWGTASGGIGFLYFDRALLDFGTPLRIAIGGGQGAGAVFEGRISGIEGRFPKSRPPEVLVLAEDRLQDLRKTRRTRVFEEASAEDVIRAVAQDHGLTPNTDIEGPTMPIVAQLNQSDLAFLRTVAANVGAEIWVRGDSLFAQSRANRPTDPIVLTYGQGLHEMRLCADLAHQCSKLVVGGWDPGAKETVESEAGPDSLSGESEGDTGSSVLDAAIGEKVERVVHPLPISTAEGDALAGAEYRRRARRFVSGDGIAEGDSRISVGSALTFQGLGPMFDGDFTVTSVRHVFDLERGYQTEFSVERPWIGS